MNTPSPLEALFVYARTFEFAYFTGDWSVLEPHFTEDVRHHIEGGGVFGRGGEGRAEVIAGLAAGVDRVDRRFDLRIPEILEGPVTRPDGVWMRFALTFRREGLPDLHVEGTHLARFRGDAIEALDETLADGEAARAETFLLAHDDKLKPAGSPWCMATDARDLEQLDAAVGRSMVRCYGSAKSERDVAAALAVCSADFSIETVPFGITTRDRDDTATQLGFFFATFPDYAVTLDGFANGPGTVACWGRVRMTFAGDFLGRSATGKTADLPIFCVFGCEGGVLGSERFFFDLGALCEQIGVPVEDFRESLRPLRAVAA